MADPRNQKESVTYFNGVKKLDDIKPFAKKPGGSRNGFVGMDKDNNVYMVKVEQGGYVTSINQPVGNESFSAQLIREIWGTEYATDIRLIDLPSANQFQVDVIPQNALTNKKCEEFSLALCGDAIFSATSKHSHAIIVPLEKLMPKTIIDEKFSLLLGMQSSITINDTLALLSAKEDARYAELYIIAKLIGVTDLKQENIISTANQQKLVDCSSTYIYRKELDQLNIQDQRAFNVLKKFYDYPNTKLKALLAQYIGADAFSVGNALLIYKNIENIKQCISKKFPVLQTSPTHLSSTAMVMQNTGIPVQNPQVTPQQDQLITPIDGRHQEHPTTPDNTKLQQAATSTHAHLQMGPKK